MSASLFRSWGVSLVVLAGTLPLAASTDQCQLSPVEKVDCHIEDSAGCVAAGCCWQPVEPNPGNLPWCYYKAGSVKTCTLKASPKAPFSDPELAEVRQLFEANLDIQGSGMVVAAPDHNIGPGGDYYYAWMRDGALSMSAYLATSRSVADAEEKMEHWLAWVERSYKQDDPHGDIMVEPKFNIPDGTPFAGGWCRPQNDGPGLRAITEMEYAKAKPDVAQRVWNLVQKQLDWVAANYSSPGCDLWEELTSIDFFWDRYTMRKALIQGSEFAQSIGQDPQRASSYKSAAAAITQALSKHITSDGWILESDSRQKDSAVIEALNVGDLGDGIFAPLSKEVAGTLNILSHYFCNAFEVNQQAAQAGTPGVLFGRYEGDNYAGGNPWVLLTASAATLLYRQSTSLAEGASLEPEAADVLKGLLGQEVTPANLLAGGDAILNRMKTFLTNGMHMNEQINRNDGTMLSAKDLTWNYANVLKAMQARIAAVKAHSGSVDQELII